MVPARSAVSTRSRISVLRCRDCLRIQKIIPVTKATAMIDMMPPKPSCASCESDREVRVRNPPTAPLSATAAPTPIHIGANERRWPLRMR